jgi:cysteine desulfuration protein SufE
MFSINEIQDEIIEEFSELDDWMDRYQMLIDLGNELTPLADQYKTEENLIDGCQSRVWVRCELMDGRMHLTAESDALIVKGIVALLLRVLSDQRPEDVLHADLYFIERIGLREHLSPTRSNGLLAMIRQIKTYAKDIVDNGAGADNGGAVGTA